MDANDLRRGQTVMVHYPDSEIRESKRAVIVEVPPWTETVCGEERRHTDKVFVEYPNTALDGRGGLFGNMREVIHLDNIEAL